MPNLWRNRDFMTLWGAQTISLLGSQITLLALPLTAAVTLGATPWQMGLLAAVEYLPFLLVTLFVGVWVDRQRRRPLVIAADLGRALLLALVPLLAWVGQLRLEALYLVGFLAGVLTTLHAVAYQAYLPTLIDRAQLVDGNSKLELSRSLADTAGPGLAGALVQALTGPLAIALDAASFLLSALLLTGIRTAEPPPAVPIARPSLGQEIGAGLQLVLQQPVLRRIAEASATLNLFYAVQVALFVLYATRDLRLDALALGVVMAGGSLGIPLGAVLAPGVAARWGQGRVIGGGLLVATLGFALVPLAHGEVLGAASLLLVAQFLIGAGMTAYNITQVSLRQAITPERLLGRMSASMRFLIWGTIPLGSLLGGALGQTLGLRSTMIVGAAGVGLALLVALGSPVRRLGLRVSG